jgi:GntR family transcriptional regulator, histidine utilization repressor
MDTSLDPSTLHQRILGDIEGQIVSGALPPGARLPFETELAERYGCSRMTVNKVMTQLARSGLIERRRRSGSFVSRPRGEAAVLEIHDIEAEVAALGLPYTYELERRTVRAGTPEDRTRLGLASGACVVDLVALHRAGTRPFCLEERLINMAAVPEAETADFGSMPSGRWLLRQVPWTAAEHVIRAVAASVPVASSLGLKRRDACLVMERRTWNARGPVTWVRLTYPGPDHEVIARFAPSSTAG